MLTETQRLDMLACPRKNIDIVIDTDAFNEIDDQYAIAYAAYASEKLAVRAIYAAPFQNAHAACPRDGMEQSYQEIIKLLKLSAKTAPVFRGSDAFLPDEHTPVSSDAAADLARRAMDYSPDRPLYVAAIAAITNIASALLINPAIADRIVVVWLGGNALNWPDNMEFNCKQDIAAVRVVFDSGAPLVILPCMGVVSAFTTTGPELEYWLKGKSALCDYLVAHTAETAEQYARGRVWSRPIWDVSTIGWLMNDERRPLMLDKMIPTPIPEYDHHYALDDRRPPCKYVYHIYRDALFEDMLKHILPLAPCAE